MPLQDVSDFLSELDRREQRDSLGVAGFRAVSVTRKTVEASAQVPTAYLEDGSFANDHIILDPVTQIIEGEAGDLYLQPSAFLEALREIQSGLGGVAGYLPGKTQAQLSRVTALASTIRDGLQLAESAINAGQSALDFFGSEDSEKPIPDQFVDAIFGLRSARALVPVELNGRTWNNMAIVGSSFTRDNEGRMIAFEVSFQQLRFVELEYVDPENPFPNAGEGTNGATQSGRDKGTQSGEQVETSAAFDFFGGSLGLQ